MTLFESIKNKLADGWNKERLEAHYNWIIPSHLDLIVREARRDLKIEDDVRRGINLWANP